MLQKLNVLDTDDPDTVEVDGFISCVVPLRLARVYSAIQLHSQLVLGAVEVRDKSAQGVLPPKFQTVEPAITHQFPKELLGRSLALP